MLIKESKKTKTSVPHSVVEKSAALRYTFHVALRIIFLIKYFISYTLLLVSLHLTMDEVKKTSEPCPRSSYT